MIAGASVSFFKPEFGDFLYALIGSDEDKGHLTVLSALSRLDIDPWKEAAELSALPVDTADPDPLVLPLVKIILSRR